MIPFIVIVLLFTLLAFGTPVGFAMTISGALGLYMVGGMTAVIAIFSSTPHDSAAVYMFVVIPMFLLMAEFVLRSGIADDLYTAASAWCGRLPGGLGIATAFAGAAFGAICGSSTASAATLSSTSLKAMIERGYEPRMAAGVVAISGTLAMLIPPSVAMVIYGLIADVNVGQLLIAGVIPGIVVMTTIIVTTMFLAIQDPKRAPIPIKVSLMEKIKLTRLVGPMLVLFVAVTVVIYLGVATPTEASAFGAFVAGVFYFTRKKRTLTETFDVISRSVKTSCMIAVIVLGAHIFSTFFAVTNVTQHVVTFIGTLDVEPWMVILGLVLLYIVLGCVMDQLAILVLTVPIAAPLVHALGFDLVWFGVIVIISAELGMVTPPMGLNCFIVSKYSGLPLREIFIGVLPHVLTHIIAIGILLLFPALTLWLPNNMH